MRLLPQNNTKIIFLDFDGVITTLESNWRLDNEKLNLLKQIIDATDAKIVITSSWRRGNIESTKTFITDPENPFVRNTPFYPLNAVIDETKRIICNTVDGILVDTPRGLEVSEWIKRMDIWNYIILDDTGGYLSDQRERWICTDDVWGLKPKDVQRAIEILNRGV